MAFSLRQGQGALAEDDLDRAVELLQGAKKRAPRRLEPRLWLASALSELGDITNALAELEEGEGVAKAGQQGVLFLWKGRILLDHNRFEPARELFVEALEQDAKNLHLPAYATLAAWACGDEQEAVKQVVVDPELHVAGPQLWGRWLALVELRFPGGAGSDYPPDEKKARTFFERLRAWRGGRALRRARKSLASGRFDRAARQADDAELLWPSLEPVSQARFEASLGRVEVGRGHVERHGDDVDERLMLAEDLLDIGNAREAQEVLAPVPELIDALDATRFDWHAQNALIGGRVSLGLGDAKEALERLHKARKLSPYEIEPSYYYGVAATLANNPHEARRAFIDTCGFDSTIGLLRLREHEAATQPIETSTT